MKYFYVRQTVGASPCSRWLKKKQKRSGRHILKQWLFQHVRTSKLLTLHEGSVLNLPLECAKNEVIYLSEIRMRAVQIAGEKTAQLSLICISSGLKLMCRYECVTMHCVMMSYTTSCTEDIVPLLHTCVIQVLWLQFAPITPNFLLFFRFCPYHFPPRPCLS